MRRTSDRVAVAVAAVLLLAGCQPATPPPPVSPSQSATTQTPGGDSAAPVDTPTAPAGAAIAGRYQCTAARIPGVGSSACNSGDSSTFEPLFVISADGSYSWGQESGTYTYDGQTATFSHGETATFTGRRMDLSAAGAVYQYTRMD